MTHWTQRRCREFCIMWFPIIINISLVLLPFLLSVKQMLEKVNDVKRSSQSGQYKHPFKCGMLLCWTFLPLVFFREVAYYHPKLLPFVFDSVSTKPRWAIGYRSAHECKSSLERRWSVTVSWWLLVSARRNQLLTARLGCNCIGPFYQIKPSLDQPTACGSE